MSIVRRARLWASRLVDELCEPGDERLYPGPDEPISWADADLIRANLREAAARDTDTAREGSK